VTLEELEALLQETRWFENLCMPMKDNGFVQIPSLAPWANLPTCNDKLEEIADEMIWLPSSRNQDDPIHGMSIEDRCEQLGKGKEYSRRSLELYKKASNSLRSFEGHPALQAGPHNFTEAARGAALFAARRAAYEILLNHGGFWCSAMQVYKRGHWPCGLLADGIVVVL
jgi:hypothetical protein